MNGVRAFKADQRYSAATEVLMVDPHSAAERPLLAKLGMNAPVEEATTILVAPPGSVIGSFKGATNKDQIITTLTSALSSCGAGCSRGNAARPQSKRSQHETYKAGLERAFRTQESGRDRAACYSPWNNSDRGHQEHHLLL